MAKVLTGVEFRERLQECRVNGEVSDYIEGSEQFFQMPLLLGHGYWRKLQLHHGLSLSILDVEKRQAHLHKISQHPQLMPLTLSYYLSGGCRVDNDGLKGSEEETAGKSYLYCLPNTAEIEDYPAGQHICRISIKISPDFMQFFGPRLNELPTDLKDAIEHPERALLYCASSITSAQQRILKQILQWPYQGITRQLYLESKVIELLALHFDPMLTVNCSQQLRTSEIDRIHQAQDILIQNMTYPPSLSELARQVQLNERKLKEGFRQVFNTTVFGYLTQQRMQTACQLLLRQQSIAAVAAAVGYGSSTAFSNAFRRQFGISPKRYQLGHRQISS
ncbi:MAG: AraC family transcriptional regulator [Cyanobacteria bacterium J06636_16]